MNKKIILASLLLSLSLASACDIHKATAAPLLVQVLPKTTQVISFDYTDCQNSISGSFYANISNGKQGFSASLFDETTGKFIQGNVMKNTGIFFSPGYELKGHSLKLTLAANSKNSVWVSVLRN